MNAPPQRKTGPDISGDLIEAIRCFPLQRHVTHCGQPFQVSPFDIYATCPKCRARIKVRSFAAVSEIEDIFDAVFEWLTQPDAMRIAQERQRVIAEDL